MTERVTTKKIRAELTLEIELPAHLDDDLVEASLVGTVAGALSSCEPKFAKVGIVGWTLGRVKVIK